MPTTTTTYSFNKPVVGADEDAWGGYLNGNWDSVDDLLDGTTPVTGIDINSGTLDGVTIGGTTAGAGTFTTLTANTSITGTLATAAQTNITSVGTLTGLTVSGSTSLAGASTSADITFGDSDKAIFGAGSDLQIYHDGSHSYISDQGTGNLRVLADNLYINNAANTQNYISGVSGGALNLFHNGNAKLATTSTGIDVTGTVTADGLTVDNGSSGQSKITISEGGADTRNLVLYSPATSGVNGKIAIEGTTANLDFVVNNGAQTAIRIGGSTGDISFYEDTGTTAKFFWDASAESLGIGTSSPVRQIHSHQSSGGSTNYALFTNTTTGSTSSDGIIVGLNATSDGYLWNYEAGNLVFGTSSAERMRIDSSGNVGIGTSNPNLSSSPIALTVGGSAEGSFEVQGSRVGTDGNVGGLRYYNGSNQLAAILTRRTGADNSGSIILYTASAGSLGEAMRIDSSGNVGIGTTSPYRQLQVGNYSSDATLALAAGSTNFSSLFFSDGDGAPNRYVGSVQYNHATNYMLFNTSGSERMRIDSSGNLLVGTTNTTPGIGDTDDGAVLGAAGWGFFSKTYSSADTSSVLYVGRNGTDGNIINIAKDGTTVGSIGVASSAIHLGNQDTGIRFAGGADAIQPWNTGTNAARDAAIDLGQSGTRFKDLYLSGGVYLGGTGSSNQLSDYEEGTYTPVVNTESGTAYTLSTANGYYRKVGSLVHIEVDITFTAEGSGTITLISLPFTPRGNTEIINGYVTSGANRRSIQLTHYSGANVLVRVDDGSAFQNYWTAKSTWAPTNSFRFAGTYIDNS